MRRQLVILFATVLGLSPVSNGVGQATSGPTTLVGPQSAPPQARAGNQRGPEIVSLRTRTSRTYTTAAGDKAVVIYPGSINYQGAAGNWQPIDNTLVPSAAPGYAVQNKSNDWTVRFPSDLGKAPIRVDGKAGWVEFSLVGGSGPGAASGNTETYTLPGGSIQYSVDNEQVKESITLSGPSSSSAYGFSLRTSPGLTAEQSAAGGIEILDASRHSVFTFSSPWMQDSSHASTGFSRAVSLTLSQASSGQTVTIAADRTWLSDPARKWPVIIDPSISPWLYSPKLNQDCKVAGGTSADSSFCTQQGLTVGYDGTSASRSLLQFDIANTVEWDSTVQNADLALYLSSASTANTTPVSVHAVTHSWTNGATWNKYDGTNAWTAPGGDFNATAAATTSGVGASTGWVHWYPTQLVKDWVENGVVNNGFLLKESTENVVNSLQFYSSEYSSSSYWPYLTVYVTESIGERSFYTLVGQQLDDHMGLGVNVASGWLDFHATDLAMSGVGLPLTFDRWYNSRLINATDLGEGWHMSGGGDVGLILWADGSVSFQAPSFYQVPFFKNADGSFASPPGIDADLVRNADGSYTLTFHESGGQLVFWSTGVLNYEMDRAGNKVTFGYGLASPWPLTSITDTQGRTTTLTYNASNYLSQMTDPAGRIYQYGYDANNNLVSYTDPAGKVTQYAYDANHELTQVTDPDGNVTKVNYGMWGLVTSIVRVTNPTTGTGPTTTFTYNSWQTTVTDPNGHNTSYSYDNRTRVTSITDPESHTGQTSWTSDHHVAQTKLPSGATTTHGYDAKNNPTKVTLPTNASATAQYGNTSFPYLPTSVTDAQENTTSFQYNAQGLPTGVTDALQHTSTATYNANGTPASVTDANGNKTSYAYNTQGLLSQVTPPTPLGSYSCTYNSSNLPASQTDGKGQASTFSYDAIGRVTGITYTDAAGRAAGSIAYVYDADGNVLSMTDTTGTTTYAYDALNQVTKKTLPNGQTISYTYDNDGNLLTKADSAGTVTYAYGADGEVTSVTDRQNAKTTLSYDQDGNNTQIAFPNGVAEAMTYNSGGQLTKLAGTAGNKTLTSFTYSYTNPSTNQVTELPYSVTDASSNVTSYTYDANEQLTQAIQKNSKGSQIASYGYGYDAAGNMASKNVNGTSTTFAYNAADELTQASGGVSKTYTYDANGALSSASNGLGLTYNPQHQTTSITPPGGSAVSMTYTGQGQGERVSAGSTKYQYDAAGLGTFTNSSGTTNLTTLPDGTLISESISSGTYYYLWDGSGSVAGLTSSSGSLVDQYSYDPQGNIVSQSATVSNSFTFQGWMWDGASGLYYAGGTYYDPTAARPVSGCRYNYDYSWVDPGEDCGPPGEDEFDPCAPPSQGGGGLGGVCGFFDKTFCAASLHSPLGSRCIYQFQVRFTAQFINRRVNLIPLTLECAPPAGANVSVSCPFVSLGHGRVLEIRVNVRGSVPVSVGYAGASGPPRLS